MICKIFSKSVVDVVGSDKSGKNVQVKAYIPNKFRQVYLSVVDDLRKFKKANEDSTFIIMAPKGSWDMAVQVIGALRRDYGICLKFTNEEQVAIKEASFKDRISLQLEAYIDLEDVEKVDFESRLPVGHIDDDEVEALKKDEESLDQPVKTKFETQ